MNIRLRRVVVGTLAALLCGVVAPATVAHAPDPQLAGGAMEQDAILEFRWRAGSEPPSALRSAIVAAATDIAETRQSRAALFDYSADAPNPIGYGSGATCGPAGIACFTRSVPDRFTMWFRQQGYPFDWGTLRWCQAYSSPPTGCFDVENIALDEFAHIEGLGHHVNYADERDYLDAVVQTYSRQKPEEGYNKHTLGPCDVATLQRLYDIETLSQLYSTCLDLSTTLALAAVDGTVLSGAPATLKATLRVTDIDSYGLLGNNLVSKRTVTLQRRPAGTTSWTSVGTMTPGASGTYTLDWVVNATTEFRAVFKASTADGLRGDTSPTVKVTTSGCTRPPC